MVDLVALDSHLPNANPSPAVERPAALRSALWTYGELADFTKIPKGSLRTMVSRREIPHLRVGPRTVRFDPAVIVSWLDRRARGDQ